MAGKGKYETICPNCQAKLAIPWNYSGKVKCPTCSFIWLPKNTSGTLKAQNPKRKFAMTLGDTIEYGFSMIPLVIMAIIISSLVAWGGFEIIAMSPDAENPEIAICIGVVLIAFSSIVFISLNLGIGVRIVAEGVMIGNIASDEIKGEKENLTIPDSLVDDENKDSISTLDDQTDQGIQRT